MPDFINLTCPNCGGKLQITNDLERFACGFCGNEHIVKRAGGVVSLLPIVSEIKKVSVGVDKTASELAIQRLRKDQNDFYALIRHEEKRLSANRKMVNVVIGLSAIALLSLLSKSYWFAAICFLLDIIFVISIINFHNSAKNKIIQYEADAAEIKKEINAHLRKVRLTES